LALVLNGADVVIAKDNIPLARLVPVEPQGKKGRAAGLHTGAIRMSAE
jgi:antitoxin (DNA-binding transcriptional repressor) of toxin-antitoxin stability system